MKVNLFVVGAPKCGTTSWAQYLQQHPEIDISDPKEPMYFCSDLQSQYNLELNGISDYEALFSQREGISVYGEATPLYLYSEVALRKIHAYNPNSKIVVLLRDQPNFIRSLHQQFLYRRIELNKDIKFVWENSGKRDVSDSDEPDVLQKMYDYKSFGKFDEQVDRLLELFPPENVLVARMEDWAPAPIGLYNALTDFLKISRVQDPEFTRENAAKFHKFDVISKITNRPPRALINAAKIVRRLTGRQRLGLAEKIRHVNSVSGYRDDFSEDLRSEILDYYSAGNLRMYQKLEALGCLYKA